MRCVEWTALDAYLPSISHGGSDVERATLQSDDGQPIKITENGSDESIFLGDYKMMIGARKLRGGVKPFITSVPTSNVGLGEPIARCKMPHEVMGAEGGGKKEQMQTALPAASVLWADRSLRAVDLVQLRHHAGRLRYSTMQNHHQRQHHALHAVQ